MKTVSLLLAICIGIYGFSQSNQPQKINPKAIPLYEKALDLLQAGDARSAIPMLTDCIRIDSNYIDAYLSLAGACGELKKYQQSVTLYEKARSMDSNYFKVFNLPYSINLAGLGRFEEALKAVTIFANIPRISERGQKSAAYRKRCYEFAIEYAKKHPNNNYSFMPVNLGDSVNTPMLEYYPSVTVTDSLLVFTRRTGPQREDFVESRITKQGFSQSKLIEGDINIEPAKGAITVSQDGEWLLFAANISGKGYGDFDIFISYATPQGWSEPQNMGESINTEFWESSPSLSPDKRALYFSSNRPGGYGGRDLYVSYRQANGKWTPAVNMGPAMNTAGDEFAPFIHADNQTLYFHSDGLPGYGGSDLFIARKGANGEWGAPENLGYPINTIENEGSLAVSADGLTAYYASDRSDSRGGLDPYKFELRPDIRPYRTIYVKGKVIDVQTKNPLPSNIELIDNSSNLAFMKVQTDEVGDYFITLPIGKDYTFTVNRKGYLFYSEVYGLSKKEADSTYHKDILLQPVALNASFTFRNILFANNEYRLPETGLAELDQLVQVLKDNPSLQVQISGHTDNVGKAEDNLVLSTNRAKAIVDYLASKSIDTKRLTYKGYGASKPVADNVTEAGRALNRRTSFTIIGM